MFVTSLEPRVLFSSSFVGKVLTVTGTTGNDVIRLAVVGDRLAVFEGGKQTASFKQVKSIIVEAGDGRDSVVIDANVTLSAKLIGGNQNDTLTGGSGPDVLYGKNGHDQLNGGDGIDALIGGNHNDTLNGGFGDDYLDGQDGSDTVTYAGRQAAMSGDLVGWIDTICFGSGGSAGEKDRYVSVEALIGGSGNDTLSGGMSNDNNAFEPGIPTAIGTVPALYGGPGDDTFLEKLNSHNAAWFGQAGNDTFNMPRDDDASIDAVDGGDGVDLQIVDRFMDFNRSYNRIFPNIENARLDYVNVAVFYGNDLDNVITTTQRGITIFGQDGNDQIVSSPDVLDVGGDTFEAHGGAGNDTITSALAGSRLYGDDGNDVLKGGPDNDTLDGGAGDDALFGFDGDDLLGGASDNDYIEGGNGVDALFGGTGNDILRGGSGADYLEGNAGNDTFYTRDRAADSLIGGPGTDTAQRDASEAIIDSIENTIA